MIRGRDPIAKMRYLFQKLFQLVFGFALFLRRFRWEVRSCGELRVCVE
jgi:hypothetical protein